LTILKIQAYQIKDSNQHSHSPFIDELLERVKIEGVHLTAETPPEKKLNISDPNWRFPRGVVQRNVALSWIRSAKLFPSVFYTFNLRENLGSWQRGVSAGEVHLGQCFTAPPPLPQ
jgi:hypothetical protein